MGVIGRPALANFRAKVPSMCPTKRVISTNDPHTGRGGETSRCTICGESGGYCCTVVGNTEGVHVHYTFFTWVEIYGSGLFAGNIVVDQFVCMAFPEKVDGGRHVDV